MPFSLIPSWRTSWDGPPTAAPGASSSRVTSKSASSPSTLSTPNSLPSSARHVLTQIFILHPYSIVFCLLFSAPHDVPPIFAPQANGWGFRRMSHGYDKNAYYHEYFLRAMPWLCKKMRRPKVAEKKAVNPDMEPDLDAISLQLPVPDAPPTREVLVLQKTIELGPKARMPVMWDTGTPPQAPSSPVGAPQVPPPAVENPSLVENFPPLDRNTSYGDLKPAALPNPPPVAGHTPQDAGTVSMVNMGNNVHNILPQNSIPPPSSQNNMNAAFTYAAAGEATPSNRPNNTNEASLSSLASDSNFAAGFMAATAYHSNHIRNMLSSAFVAGMPIPSNGNVVMPSAVAATAPVTSAAHLGSAFELLQRVGMAQANLHPQESPGFAAVAATSAARTGGNTNRNFNNNSALSGQAMQRLQQFQEFSSKFY
mmetsp:Transcript_47894/g.101769  ORF Transcript_47894/g.101769 Transcript_47894/m.101769 type:complete len:424 (+) Transcript_47894:531-1802(+)